MAKAAQAVAKAITPKKRGASPLAGSAKARQKASGQIESKRAKRQLEKGFETPAARAMKIYDFLERVREASGGKIDWRPYVVGLLCERRDGRRGYFVRRTGSEAVNAKQCFHPCKDPESGYVRVTVPKPILRAAKQYGIVPDHGVMESGKATLTHLVLLAAGRLPSGETAGDWKNMEASHICFEMTPCQRHIKWEDRRANQSRGVEHTRGRGDPLHSDPPCIDPTSPSLEDAWVDWSLELLREACEYFTPVAKPTLRFKMRSQYKPRVRMRWKGVPPGVPLERLSCFAEYLALLQENVPGD